MPVCCVRFEARELWGEKVEAGCTIYADLYEHYVGDVLAAAA